MKEKELHVYKEKELQYSIYVKELMRMLFSMERIQITDSVYMGGMVA